MTLEGQDEKSKIHPFLQLLEQMSLNWREIYILPKNATIRIHCAPFWFVQNIFLWCPDQNYVGFVELKFATLSFPTLNAECNSNLKTYHSKR